MQHHIHQPLRVKLRPVALLVGAADFMPAWHCPCLLSPKSILSFFFPAPYISGDVVVKRLAPPPPNLVLLTDMVKSLRRAQKVLLLWTILNLSWEVWLQTGESHFRSRYWAWKALDPIIGPIPLHGCLLGGQLSLDIGRGASIQSLLCRDVAGLEAIAWPDQLISCPSVSKSWWNLRK